MFGLSKTYRVHKAYIETTPYSVAGCVHRRSLSLSLASSPGQLLEPPGVTLAPPPEIFVPEYSVAPNKTSLSKNPNLSKEKTGKVQKIYT